MERIEKYIEKLLLTHDCVILPDLGGFVTHYEPHYQSEEDHSFFPPTRSLSFNPQLLVNDGLLVQAYMQTYDTTYPEASRLLKQEIDKIKHAIDFNGSYRFENLGVLELNSDNNLVYMPDKACGVASPEFYGLESYVQDVFSPVQTEGKQDEIQPVFTHSHVASNEKNTKDYIIRLNRTFTNYAAAAVVAIVSFLTLSSPVVESQNKEQGLTASSSLMYSFPLSYKHTVETTKTVTKPVQKAPEAEIQPTVSEAPYYTIVMASAIKQSNANTFIEQLGKEGLKEARFIMDKNMSRVIYSKFASEADAYRALRNLRRHTQFSDAWVLKIKP